MAFKPSGKTKNNIVEAGSPEWLQWSRDIVRNTLDEYLPAYATDAEVGLLRDEIFSSGRLDDARHVVTVAKRWISQDRLSYRASVREALAQAQQVVAQYDLTSAASQRLIIGKAEEMRATGASFDFDNVDDLVAIADSLGQSAVIPLSETGRREQQQARANAEDAVLRMSLISRIALGKPQFSIWSPRHGRAMPVDSSSLEHETTERLKEICDSVERYRAIRDGKPVAPVAQQVDEGVSATVSAQKSIPFMGGENSLINERTGLEFTKAEVYDLAKNNLPMFRKLMARNTKRLNEILAQA